VPEPAVSIPGGPAGRERAPVPVRLGLGCRGGRIFKVQYPSPFEEQVFSLGLGLSFIILSVFLLGSIEPSIAP